jgi:hypothetical protein
MNENARATARGTGFESTWDGAAQGQRVILAPQKSRQAHFCDNKGGFETVSWYEINDSVDN